VPPSVSRLPPLPVPLRVARRHGRRRRGRLAAPWLAPELWHARGRRL